jgi:hypothetical protein
MTPPSVNSRSHYGDIRQCLDARLLVGRIICREENGTKLRLHYDRRGNVVAVIDVSGTGAWDGRRMSKRESGRCNVRVHSGDTGLAELSIARPEIGPVAWSAFFE